MASLRQTIKERALKIAYTASVACLLMFGMASFAHADVSQLVQSDNISASSVVGFNVLMGTSFTGSFTGFTVHISDSLSFTHTTDFALDECTDNTYTSCSTNVATGSSSNHGSFGPSDITVSVSYTPVTGMWYRLHVSSMLGSVYGTLTNLAQDFAVYNAGMNDTYAFLVAMGVNGAPVNTTTHIIDFDPQEGTTTSNPVTFNLHAYINSADLGNVIGVKLTLHNIDQNVLLLGFLSPYDIYLFQGQATTSGDFHYSTTTVLAEGNYRVEATLQRTYFGGVIVNTLSPLNQDLNHQFIVGTSTFLGNLSQNSFRELQSILASTTATSTSALAGSCNPIGGNFSIINCVTFLLVPGGDSLQVTLNGLHDGILSRAPWGYLERAYTIFSDTSTSSLPSFVVHIPEGANASDTLSFNMDDMISGGAATLDSVRDPRYNLSVRDVAEPIIKAIVYTLVILTILTDLMGSHKRGQRMEQGGSNNKKLS